MTRVIFGNSHFTLSVIASVALVVMSGITMISYMPQVNEAYAELDFFSKFGTEGTANEQFKQPVDIVLYRNGANIFVVDKENDRISTFYPDGKDVKFRDTFGAQGTGDAKLTSPSSIARIDGDFFVLDDKKIKVFDKDGDYERTFVTNKIGNPTAIATHDKLDLVFVSDTSGNKIHVFTDQGVYKYDINKLTNSDNLKDPGGIAVDTSSDYLYVSDSGNHRIAVFEINKPVCDVGTTHVAGSTAHVVDKICFVKTFGVHGTTNATFTNPTRLAVDLTTTDTRGDLYVADTNNHRVQILRFVDGSNCPTGTQNVTSVSNNASVKVPGSVCFVGEFGSNGANDGQFKKPHGMAIDSKNRLLYVADTENNRVQVIKLDSQAVVSSSSSSSSSTSTPSTTPTTQNTKPNSPRNISAIPTSPESILVKWSEPLAKGNPPIPIIGYKVEYREKTSGTQNSEFQTLVEKTSTNSTSIHHTNLDPATTYTYRVYAISTGSDAASTSLSSNTKSAKTASTNAPTIVNGVALAPQQIKLAWLPPSETFRQSITGYSIEKAISSSDKYIPIDDVGGTTTEFVYSVKSGETKVKFVVIAKLTSGSSPKSAPITIAVDSDSSHSGAIAPQLLAHTKLSKPTPPLRVQAEPVSETRIDVSWRTPTDSGNTPITGYTIEAKKKDASAFTVLASGFSATTYQHKGLTLGSEYTYRVYATNAIGDSDVSNESIAITRAVGITIAPIGSMTADAGKLVTFTARVSGESASNAVFGLSANAPTDASISSGAGIFQWTPSSSDAGESFVFDVIATQGSNTDNESVRIRVNTVSSTPDNSQQEQQPPPQQQDPDPVFTVSNSDEPKLADFLKDDDPQIYIDRYNNEPSFKEWFDTNYLDQFNSIYDAVGILQIPADFVDATQDPQYYVDRYNTEESFKVWFDENYSKYDSIHHAVGLIPDEIDKEPEQKDTIRELPRLDVSLAPFVNATEDPMTYVDRYNTEDSFKMWFDVNHAEEYGTIYRAVGLLDVPASFVDATEDPMTYVDRYNTDESFKMWFDENYSEYLSIYHAVGLEDPLLSDDDDDIIQYGICGPGTMLIEGVCTIILDNDDHNNNDA